MNDGFSSKIRNFSKLGLAHFGATIINAVFWMYLASQLDKSEYGLLGYLLSIATVAHASANLGFYTSIVVYGAKKENILSPVYTLGIISSTLASIVAYVITQNVGVSFYIWGMMIFLLKTADINSKKLYGTFAKYRILRTGLTIIIGLVLLQFFGVNGIILGFAFATLPALGGVFNYVKNKKISITVLKPKMKFMVNSWLVGLNKSLFRWGDKVLIGSLLGFSVLGGYHLAFQYLLMLDAIPNSLAAYLLPQESEGKRNKKIKIFAVGISCVAAFISIIILPYIIDSFFPAYQESILPGQILSIGIIPITIYTVYESKFFGKQRPKLVLIGNALQTILYFLLIIFLGLEFGITGLAISFLISTVIRTIYAVVVDRIIIEK